ncbi:hypothetical protein BWQ96_01875 [Gracilariopsis chorda]|uniref:Spp2/MOS2 G-patch domain-containing protein n=1 Tax=Gracilariopsis chorda TaxID=448386 RepID=A0A2V3J225_9FLOR|nr:hypothetical protein BWQ96_01875 [Gracilariopsis chorda]|eukprot:PXF48415.1 hypothetical protein BWQ96_01875 [Gracilariopsis chorda]
MNFQINIKRTAARRKKARANTLPPLKKQPSAFASEHDSDASTDASRPRKITTVSTPAPKTENNQSTSVKAEQQAEAQENTTRPKTSQIARLVERRKEAQLSSSTNRDQRDNVLFQYDLSKCAEGADGAGYDQRPVDGFGEMMLKAMGWSGKKSAEEKHKAPVPRPSRLGLGAKLDNQKKPPPTKRLRSTANDRVLIANGAQHGAESEDNGGNGVTIDSRTTRLELNGKRAHDSEIEPRRQTIDHSKKRPRFSSQ